MPWDGFWGRLGSMHQLRPLHWAGLFVILAALTVGLVGSFAERWPSGSEPWWSKLFFTYGWYLGLLIIVILSTAITNTLNRRPPRR